MVYSFISVFLGSFITRSEEKTLVYLEYLAKTLIKILSYYNATIWVAQKRWINDLTSSTATYITKVSNSLSSIVLANSFLSVSLMQLVMGKISVVI